MNKKLLDNIKWPWNIIKGYCHFMKEYYYFSIETIEKILDDCIRKLHKN